MIPGVDPKVDFAFKKGLSAIHVGQTFLSGIKSLVLLADRNVCPTSIHKNGGDPKKVFGSESNIPLPIDLLHAVLKPPANERIVSLEILNPFNVKDALTDKQSVLDIKVRDAAGKLYNVEMQMAASLAFPQRMLYYWALMYGRQLHESEDFAELRKTISICFVNSVLFPKVPDYHLEFQLRSDRHPALVFCPHQSMHVVELPKFRRAAEELTDPLEIWCYFLINGAVLDKDDLPAALRVAPVEKAMEVLEMLTKNDREWFEYQARRMWKMDRKTELREAREEGLREGVEKGLREGVEKGLREGVEKGEIIGRIHLCQRLLKQSMSEADELSVLPIEELRGTAAKLEKQLGAPSP